LLLPSGPDKPWVEDSRIEERAIAPWLEAMEQESMPIPHQLPLEPTENLFAVLGSDRTGAQWIMKMLEGHPHICASGEADKPETGFSADSLLPDGLPWYPHCSIKRGCTFEFFKTGVAELLSNVTDAEVPFRCTADYDPEAHNDPYRLNLKRLCNFVDRLEENYDASNIAQLWVDAFVSEDRNLVGCGCVRGVRAKGLKVMTEWIISNKYPYSFDDEPRINLNTTKVHGSKIIRLKRRNLWARYKSMVIAHQTDMYHPTTPGEKRSQIAAFKEYTVEYDHLVWNMKNMERLDRAGDEWASEHGSEVLTVYYEDCRADPAACFENIYKFVGVDESHVTGKQAKSYASTFSSFAEAESNMDNIKNKGEVLEILAGNNWAHFVSDAKHIPVQYMVYEESYDLVSSRHYMNINATLYGRKDTRDTGARYKAATDMLKTLDPDSLVVLSSDRTSRLNLPVGGDDTVFKFLDRFRRSFNSITRDYPGSVVVSSVAECCAAALTHKGPGELFGDGLKRVSRACSSGEPDCGWNGEEKAVLWQTFMKELASQRSDSESKYAYLDTSLIAGKAKDLLKVFVDLDLQSGEDDRAVWTDFMYRRPKTVILDYDQQIFGESRRPPIASSKHSCIATSDDSVTVSRRLDELDQDHQPMFMFTPRRLGCDDERKLLSPKYPIWDRSGVVLRPILEHMDRVVNMTESVVLPPMYGRKPDYAQGPEVPYFFDEQGIWTSRTIRERTNNVTLFWRAMPTEDLFKAAHQILLRDNQQSSRWPALVSTLKSGGFPFFAW
jgi:LPS sulfotransferase NodH